MKACRSKKGKKLLLDKKIGSGLLKHLNNRDYLIYVDLNSKNYRDYNQYFTANIKGKKYSLRKV